jgi:hypothetical protein
MLPDGAVVAVDAGSSRVRMHVAMAAQAFS